MSNLTSVDTTEVSAALVTVAERVAGMVRELPDTAIPIPGSEWTVGETAAHLAFTNIGLAMMARGLCIPYADGTREGFAEANAVSLEGYPDRDGALLAGRIVEGVRTFLAEAAAQPPGGTYVTPMGEMDIDTFRSYVLTHNLMHGCAMADALGLPYPYEPAHAPMVWRFLSHAITALGRGVELEATLELHVEGAFDATLVFAGGAVSVEPPARTADATVWMDPVTFFLVVVQLLSPADAMGRGGMRVAGPRPELGTKFWTMYEVP